MINSGALDTSKQSVGMFRIAFPAIGANAEAFLEDVFQSFDAFIFSFCCHCHKLASQSDGDENAVVGLGLKFEGLAVSKSYNFFVVVELYLASGNRNKSRPLIEDDSVDFIMGHCSGEQNWNITLRGGFIHDVFHGCLMVTNV